MAEEKLNNQSRPQYTGTDAVMNSASSDFSAEYCQTRPTRNRITLHTADTINDVMVERKFSRPFWESSSDSSVVQPIAWSRYRLRHLSTWLYDNTEQHTDR